MPDLNIRAVMLLTWHREEVNKLTSMMRCAFLVGQGMDLKAPGRPAHTVPGEVASLQSLTSGNFTKFYVLNFGRYSGKSLGHATA